MKNQNGFSLASRLFAPACATLLLTAGQAQAASISYVMDQSNALRDGVSYLQVTISDGAEGAINFTVQALQPLLDIAGKNFGIQAFGFNVGAGLDTDSANLTNLPAGWKTRENFRMASFGVFDLKLYAGGRSRLKTLTFSIDGIDGDTPGDYAFFSTGKAGDGNQLFAAHVAGFEFCGRKKCLSSAFFGGGTTVVPLPATAWLFATGLIGALVRARRRMAS